MSNLDPSLSTSYRPIAVTSVLGKLFQRILNKGLYWFLESNNLLSFFQYGFHKSVTPPKPLSTVNFRLTKPLSLILAYILSSLTFKKHSLESGDIISQKNSMKLDFVAISLPSYIELPKQQNIDGWDSEQNLLFPHSPERCPPRRYF